MEPRDLLPIIVAVSIVGLVVIVIAALWRIYAKAGEPGWTVLAPIYNSIVLLRIVGMSLWWVIPLLIPYVGIIVSIIVCIKLARAFGKGGGFAMGLILLPFVFIPILGFGSATYLGPAGPGAREKMPSGADDFEDELDHRPRKARRRRDADEDDFELEAERPRKTSTLTARPSAPSKPAAGKATVVRCMSCEQRLRVPWDVVGRKVKCPQCENVFVA